MFEERALVVAAVAAGRSLRSIGSRFDISPGTARIWYIEASPADSATIAASLAVLAEGWSIADTAEAAEVPRWRVREWVRASRRL